jgi:hypothetical protein
MPVQFNPYPSQIQNVAANPFAQRGEDQLKRASNGEDQDRNRTDIRAQGTSTAESQPSETRNTEQRQATARDDRDEPRNTQTRGRNVDITV